MSFSWKKKNGQARAALKNIDQRTKSEDCTIYNELDRVNGRFRLWSEWTPNIKVDRKLRVKSNARYVCGMKCLYHALCTTTK